MGTLIQENGEHTFSASPSSSFSDTDFSLTTESTSNLASLEIIRKGPNVAGKVIIRSRYIWFIPYENNDDIRGRKGSTIC